MARLSGLGRGLDALIPADQSTPSGGGALRDLPVTAIVPNPHQPRVHFDEESLTELAASVKELGVLQPILVRPDGESGFQLIAGERRWRAAQRAGLTSIPAIVRESNDLSSVEQALVENLHRQDLTALEEAAAFQQLIEDFGLTHESIAVRVGKSRAAISNTLRLLALPPGIQHLLADGRLSAGHARALLGSTDRAFQQELAQRATEEGWSVRAVEEAVRLHERPETTPEPAQDVDPAVGEEVERPDGRPRLALRPPGLLELEELLAEHLETRVAVNMTQRKGRIQIEFADLADLERIYRRMTEALPDD
ncbi:MAG: ParB/RepB/Spo0J family partition protein [Ilumatobacteraceae bacterium]